MFWTCAENERKIIFGTAPSPILDEDGPNKGFYLSQNSSIPEIQETVKDDAQIDELVNSNEAKINMTREETTKLISRTISEFTKVLTGPKDDFSAPSISFTSTSKTSTSFSLTFIVIFIALAVGLKVTELIYDR